MYSLGSFIFYNKKLFDEAGVPHPPASWDDASWTWDNMVSRAKALTKNYGDREKGQYGLAITLNDLYVGVPWLFGAEIFPQQDYQTAKVDSVQLATPEAIAALQAKADLVYKDKVAPTPSTRR